MDRNDLLEVVLALECKIIKGTDVLRTLQLKRMLMETKRMYKELGGNYEWCKRKYRSLQTDAKSVLFTNEQINDNIFKKTKKIKT